MKIARKITGIILVSSLLVSAAIAGQVGLIEENVNVKQTKDPGKSIAAPADKVRIIVTLKTNATDNNIQELMGRIGSFKVEGKGWDQVYPNGFAATVTKKQMLDIQKDPAVLRIDISRKMQIQLETANYWSGVTKARAPKPLGLNVTGDRDGLPYSYSKTDVVIAIVDTGIDPYHKDLNGTNNGGTSKVIGWHDSTNSRYNAPIDDNGHGTHVASIAAGEGDDNPRYMGVAPGSALVGIKVLTDEGWGYWDWVIDGVNWGVQNRNLYGIRVMSLSLGGYGSSDGTDPVSVSINNAVNSGIVVTVAAGNAGPQKYTISSPGAAANAITVGAIADPGYLLRTPSGAAVKGLTLPISPDNKNVTSGSMVLEDNGWYLAPWSSRGPTADNRIKPDVVAPGVNIMAAEADIYSHLPHGGYIKMSGTSMATPFVAGVAALMLDAKYSLSPAKIKSELRDAAEDYGFSGCDIDYGCGRLRAYRSVGEVQEGSNHEDDQWVPTHLRYSSSINDSSLQKDYPVTITNDYFPYANTLIMYDWSGYYYGIDLDMSLTDPSGNYFSTYGYDRQENLVIAPGGPGKYNTRVDKWTGSGRYSIDISKQ